LQSTLSLAKKLQSQWRKAHSKVLVQHGQFQLPVLLAPAHLMELPQELYGLQSRAQLPKQSNFLSLASAILCETRQQQAQWQHLPVFLEHANREGILIMVLLRHAVGQSLRAARTSQSRTLREVAREARVSLGYLSEVERGQKEASSELLNAICTALGLALSDVMVDVTNELKSRETVTLTVVDAA
jgi:DNA-binding XRE family transcriptional regulator